MTWELDGAVKRWRNRREELFTILLSAETIMLNDIPHMLLMALDITRRKRAEEEMQKALGREKEIKTSRPHIHQSPEQRCEYSEPGATVHFLVERDGSDAACGFRVPFLSWENEPSTRRSSGRLLKIGLAIAEPGQSRMRGACLMALIGQLRLAQLTIIQLSGFRLRLFLSWRTMRHEERMPLKRSEHEQIWRRN